MPKRELTVGTRGSALALWQTEHVVERLRSIDPDLSVHVKTISTRGDRVRDRALSQVGGRGLFVKEIEQALLTFEIDIAVHSLKDMPSEQPPDLVLGAVLERADARDALIIRDRERDLAALSPGARVGTSSLRRRSQLLAVRPDLEIVDLRGNVDTRLKKLHSGAYDAIVLAVAGLERLGYAKAISQILPTELMLPAVGQGALCIEMRRNDRASADSIAGLDHLRTRQTTQAERAFLRRLEGGCQVPIGAYARVVDGGLVLEGLVAALDGSCIVREKIRGDVSEADALGTRLADRLLAAGGAEVLEEVRRAI